MTDEEKMQEAKEVLKDVSTEKLREWLMTMAASKTTEMPYRGTAISYGTLINIVSGRTQAESQQ